MISANPMRMYEHIWKALKDLPKDQARQSGVRISAPRHLHRTIIKAVMKEKYMDLSYKLLNGERTAILIPSRAGSVITFRLQFSLTHVENF